MTRMTRVTADFFNKIKIRENLRYPRHPRSFMNNAG
jgi:hypothetical protein